MGAASHQWRYCAETVVGGVSLEASEGTEDMPRTVWESRGMGCYGGGHVDHAGS